MMTVAERMESQLTTIERAELMAHRIKAHGFDASVVMVDGAVAIKATAWESYIDGEPGDSGEYITDYLVPTWRAVRNWLGY